MAAEARLRYGRMQQQQLLQLMLLVVSLIAASAGELTLVPGGSSQHRSVGEKFFISCTADGSHVQHLLWVGPDGQQIRNYTGRTHVEVSRTEDHGLDLILEEIANADGGTYSCSANVDGQHFSKSFVMNVNSKTSFEGTERHQTLEEGANSSLICFARGDPKPKVRWRKNSQIIRLDTEKYVTSTDPPYTLTVRNVTLDDAGLYTCNSVQVSNHLSDVSDFDINVTVHHAPQFSTAGNGLSYAYIGGSVNLSCSAIAVPSANFSWFKNDELIIPRQNTSKELSVERSNELRRRVESIGRSINSQKYSDRSYSQQGRQSLETNQRQNSPREEEDGDARYAVYTVNHTTYLEINVSDASVFGDYECRADNTMGSVERLVVLQEGTRPPVPTVKVEQYDSVSIVLQLNVKEDRSAGHQSVQGFLAQFKRSGDEINRDVPFVKGEVYKLTGLQPSTLYVIRVASRNVAGDSEYSKQVMQRTRNLPSTQATTQAAVVHCPTTLVVSVLTFIAILRQ